MFVATSKHLFWWPVTVNMPHPENAGSFVEATFEMQFEALSMARAKQLDEEREKVPPEQQASRAFDFIFELARDWREIVDESRQPIPFSREALERMLQLPWFRTGVLAAYQQAVNGQAARLGNSVEPRVQ